MSVTLDVSRLSGWLNALAYCRAGKEEGIGRRRAWRCGPRGGRAWGGSASSLLWRARIKAGGHVQGTCGAHVKHAVHGCDAGGVPARYVCIERVLVGEEIAHVGDC
eukprot:scaffold91274_cov63-Phaeocystis_antarctica.AAC.2